MRRGWKLPPRVAGTAGQKLRVVARWLATYNGTKSEPESPNRLTPDQAGWILWPYVLALIALAIIFLDPQVIRGDVGSASELV